MLLNIIRLDYKKVKDVWAEGRGGCLGRSDGCPDWLDPIAILRRVAIELRYGTTLDRIGELAGARAGGLIGEKPPIDWAFGPAPNANVPR